MMCIARCMPKCILRISKFKLWSHAAWSPSLDLVQVISHSVKVSIKHFFLPLDLSFFNGVVGCWRWNLPEGNRSCAIDRREHHLGEADHLGHERATPKREWVWGSILITEIKRYPWEYVWGYMGCDFPQIKRNF